MVILLPPFKINESELLSDPVSVALAPSTSLAKIKSYVVLVSVPVNVITPAFSARVTPPAPVKVT